MTSSRSWAWALRLMAWCVLGCVVPAQVAAETRVDVEARVQRIASELRCLVCQNQTVADSQSGLASDLRQEVRTMVSRGDSDDAVLAFMTSRYGDFVLYRPPWKASTVLLWIAPALLLLGGLLTLSLVLRRRAQLPDELFDPDLEEPSA